MFRVYVLYLTFSNQSYGREIHITIHFAHHTQFENPCSRVNIYVTSLLPLVPNDVEKNWSKKHWPRDSWKV